MERERLNGRVTAPLGTTRSALGSGGRDAPVQLASQQLPLSCGECAQHRLESKQVHVMQNASRT